MMRNAVARVAVIDGNEAEVEPSSTAASNDAGTQPAPKLRAKVRQPEWLAGLQASALHWTVRIAALLAGLAFWHHASATNLKFYIRFDNVPGPLLVGKALIGHLWEPTFYLHVGASLE